MYVKVLKNESIADKIHRMVIDAPEIAKKARAGQFVNLYTGSDAMLLPRPFGIADICDESGTVTLVYALTGKGTARLASLGAGAMLRALGPLGNGFSVSETVGDVILLGGGLGIAPLLFAARELRSRSEDRSGRITVALGYSGEPYLHDAFAPFCDRVYIASETEGVCEYTGNAIGLADSIAERDALFPSSATVFSCGPVPMLKAASEWAKAKGLPCLVSLEARMGCGYGACVGCSIDIKSEDGKSTVKKKVCTDGPVFDAEAVIWI